MPTPEQDRALLLRQALDKIAFLPFGLLIDRYRWGIFSGQIRPGEYQAAWDRMRLQYQGIVPPSPRTEANFDAGAKYHVPASVPYTRYFLARILQFQFFKAACDIAGWRGPLHRCSFYGNREVGRRLNEMLALGLSRPWPDAIQSFTGTPRDFGRADDRIFPALAGLAARAESGAPMRLVAALCALALGASAALAENAQIAARPAPARFNPAAPENRQVLPTFNYATVEAVLTQVGARFARQGTADRPVLTVTFANGRRGAILFGSCERQGAVCKAISIQAVWNRPANARWHAASNPGSRASTSATPSPAPIVTADGRPALQRYLTADYGIIRGNLAVNLLVFANQVDRFVAEVLRPAPAPAPAAR